MRFSQKTISYRFRDGTTIDDLADRLRRGLTDPDSVPPIRVVERRGLLYTLDNRRLEAFRRAGVAVPYVMATEDDARRERWKFTTTNDGESIIVRSL